MKRKARLKIDTRKKSYQVSDSVFFKLKSKKKLSEIIGFSLAELRSLTDDRYYNCYEDLSSGKPRLIECPTGDLEIVHTRIASLICRIRQPDYMHSGIPGRSHISNAQAHVGRFPVLATDLKSFFQKTKKENIFSFFYNTMQCSSDVASLLSLLCTCSGHIPTGSRISMPLAYWANLLMFERLAKLSELHGVSLTVFVDDLTFSGNKVTRQFRQQVEKIIVQSNHIMHPDKTRLYGQDATKVITGVAVSKDGIKVANRHHKAIYTDMEQWVAIREIKGSQVLPLKARLVGRLLGKLNSQGQIDFSFKDKARSVKEALKSS